MEGVGARMRTLDTAAVANVTRGGRLMNVSERERQLRWLMTLRVVIVTTLLICVFSIELLLRPELSLRPLFTLANGTLGNTQQLNDRYARGAGVGAATAFHAILDELCFHLVVHSCLGEASQPRGIEKICTGVKAAATTNTGVLLLLGNIGLGKGEEA